MGFNKWYTNFRLEHFVRKTGLPCQMFRLLFNRIFRKLFLLMVNNLKITFMEDDKRQFLQCDQFFPLHVVYCLFFIHFTVYYN